mmetsp:Transcript_9427/g.27701  ORF Transcript_9427/g.27701 Transcript_9427/m.27701 type:complete len:533 (-) Transcript_9427:23-1621(-)
MVHPGSGWKRTLHLMVFRRRDDDTYVPTKKGPREEEMIGKWRAANPAWVVKVWTVTALRQYAARRNQRREQQGDSADNLRNVLYVAAEEGGVFVMAPFQSAPVQSLDAIYDRLPRSADFFAGMTHPGLPAVKVERCKLSKMMPVSKAVKECGSYIPISLDVFGHRSDAEDRGGRGGRRRGGVYGYGTIAKVLRMQWSYPTSPAEEIISNFDGSQVVFNWRFLQAPRAQDDEDSAPEAVVAALQLPLPRSKYDEDHAISERLAAAGGCSGDEPWAREIPKIIHQVWITGAEGKQMEPMVVPLMDEIKLKHEAEGWTYMFWGDELWDKYADEIPFELYRKDTRVPPAVVSDHFRLLILRDYGGIALDADVRLLKTFTGLQEKLAVDGVTFFAGSNFPKSTKAKDAEFGGNKVGLRGGPPLAFVALGASNCSAVVRGLLEAPLPEGRWYWPSVVESRPEWAAPLHNGWGLAMEAMNYLDETARVLSFRFFSDVRLGADAVLDHNSRHLWSWFGHFKEWKKAEEEIEHRKRSMGEL